MLIYSTDNPNFAKYGNLDRQGLVIQIALGDTGQEIFLEGVSLSASVPDLHKLIQQQTDIHPSHQRLFVGGEEMKLNSCLLNYFSTSSAIQSRGGCLLSLRCFVPILLSTLRCPGPMLTEVEVWPRNDEPVINIKRRIRDKFRIELECQRLHVHPSEMTSYVLRRPLDDARLLSTYLSPNRDGNFLEVIVIDKNDQNNPLKQEIYVRIPRKVINAREQDAQLQYSTTLHVHQNSSSPGKTLGDAKVSGVMDRLPPPPPPQTPESDTEKEACDTPESRSAFIATTHNPPEVWWISVPVRLDQIIKRDPKIEDVKKVLLSLLKEKPAIIDALVEEENTNITPDSFEDLLDQLQLKFCSVKSVAGGEVLKNSNTIYADLLMRFEEMLACVAYNNLENKLNVAPVWYKPGLGTSRVNQPTVQPVQPIIPLRSYNEPRLRFTTPRDPVKLHWNIAPANNIDCGAKPGAEFELTGASFARCYGSWDIPEHRKTYVEVTAEGLFHVGDLGLAALIQFDQDNGEQRPDYDTDVILRQRASRSNRSYDTERIVYYVQDEIEIKILGPVNASLIGSKSGRHSQPFATNSANRWVSDRRKLFDQHQEVRRGEYKNPPMPKPAPFHMRVDERCIEKALALSPSTVVPSWENRRQLSETQIGQWYLARETVSDVSVTKPRGMTNSVFATSCDRGLSIDGRPYLAVTYKRRMPIISETDTIFPRTTIADSFRKALEFRVQAQFFICTLVSGKTETADTADFTVRVRQNVTRIEHVTHCPDIFTRHESPSTGMETTLKVNLATPKWHEEKGLELPETIELQL